MAKLPTLKPGWRNVVVVRERYLFPDTVEEMDALVAAGKYRDDGLGYRDYIDEETVNIPTSETAAVFWEERQPDYAARAALLHQIAQWCQNNRIKVKIVGGKIDVWFISVATHNLQRSKWFMHTLTFDSVEARLKCQSVFAEIGDHITMTIPPRWRPNTSQYVL